MLLALGTPALGAEWQQHAARGEHGLLAVTPRAKGTGEAAAPAKATEVRYPSLVVALLFFGVCLVGVVIGLVEMFSK